MKRLFPPFLLTILLLLNGLTTTLQAQDSTAVVKQKYDNKILFLPALGSSPETGFMFGAVVVPQFKFKGTGPETRSSSVLISAIYTTKNQVLTSVLSDIVLPREQWLLYGNYFANYFPESYWGVGPFTKDSDELTTIYTQVHIEQQALRKIESGLFTGPSLRWSSLYNVRFEDDQSDRISSPPVSGANGGSSFGIGWITRWDRRNSNMTPTQNHYVQLSLMGYPSWFGATHSFTNYELDARKYIDFSSNGSSVLAVQGLFQLNEGNPPFNDLATLGGDRHQPWLLQRSLPRSECSPDAG